MGIITSLLGIVCILYYIAGVRYAGYRVSGLWIWLAAGIGLMVWGGCRMCSCRCSVLCTGCIGCDCKSLSSGGAGTVFLSGTSNRYRNESKRN